MTRKEKCLWLYFILNLLPFLPVAFLMLEYRDNVLVNDMLICGLYLNMFAYKFTRHCPFKIIAKYVIYTKGLNFCKYWRRAYGNRNTLAILTYGTYTAFIFVLTILLL